MPCAKCHSAIPLCPFSIESTLTTQCPIRVHVKKIIAKGKKVFTQVSGYLRKKRNLHKKAIYINRSQAVAGIADRTAKNCRCHVT